MTDTPASTSTSSSLSAGSDGGKVDAVGIGADVLDRVQDVLKGGKIRAVRIKLGNKTIREIPVEAAAFSAVLLAAVAVVVSQLRIEVDKA